MVWRQLRQGMPTAQAGRLAAEWIATPAALVHSPWPSSLKISSRLSSPSFFPLRLFFPPLPAVKQGRLTSVRPVCVAGGAQLLPPRETTRCSGPHKARAGAAVSEAPRLRRQRRVMGAPLSQQVRLSPPRHPPLFLGILCCGGGSSKGPQAAWLFTHRQNSRRCGGLAAEVEQMSSQSGRGGGRAVFGKPGLTWLVGLPGRTPMSVSLDGGAPGAAPATFSDHLCPKQACRATAPITPPSSPPSVAQRSGRAHARPQAVAAGSGGRRVLRAAGGGDMRRGRRGRRPGPPRPLLPACWSPAAGTTGATSAAAAGRVCQLAGQGASARRQRCRERQ